MTGTFGSMAEEYERGRPGWPADAIAGLVDRFGARTVLDLAAGTGKLTAVLAELADDVVAVEPDDGMRRVLEARLPQVRALAVSPSGWPRSPRGCAARAGCRTTRSSCARAARRRGSSTAARASGSRRCGRGRCR
jgi:hypothetical protein